MDYKLNYDLGIVIPVKGHSSRLPNKNGLPFGDQDSLLEWKISQLIQIIPKNRIYVSTEYEPFKEKARKWGVNVYDRDPMLADESKCTFSETIMGIIPDIPHKHIAWITVTSPLIQILEYINCFDKYRQYVINENLNDSLTAVNLLKEYIWDDNNPINYNVGSGHIYTQNLPNLYKLINHIFMIPKQTALKNQYFLGKNPYKAEVSKLAGVDIDYPEDYEIAKALYPLYLAKIKNNS